MHLGRVRPMWSSLGRRRSEGCGPRGFSFGFWDRDTHRATGPHDQGESTPAQRRAQPRNQPVDPVRSPAHHRSMQKHEGPRDPGNDNQPKRTTTWWLMLVIFGLLGLIASQFVHRWF